MRNRAVFLDRDGTINEDVHRLSRAEQLRLLPNVGEAIKQIRAAQFKVVVVTNQAVIARGTISHEALAEIHETMREMLQAQGATVDAIYYCPHHPTAGDGPLTISCHCRKPQPGMLFQAAEELNIALEHSFMVGDKLSDIASGQAAGCRTALVRTGYGAEEEKQLNGGSVRPDTIAPDLLEVAKWILQQAS
ncbi:MAG: D-glycero-beta-D-manno-heptose 1,7-bisphosphate 7-phosphatase [Anaerolineaceae bacterium]|nr:MAG: D-glycero-beta-D-manno-heptose 1,7-bisphosphate 7-phosphatase [Anaerolineaceae bacterium]